MKRQLRQLPKRGRGVPLRAIPQECERAVIPHNLARPLQENLAAAATTEIQQSPALWDCSPPELPLPPGPERKHLQNCPFHSGWRGSEGAMSARVFIVEDVRFAKARNAINDRVGSRATKANQSIQATLKLAVTIYASYQVHSQPPGQGVYDWNYPAFTHFPLRQPRTYHSRRCQSIHTASSCDSCHWQQECSGASVQPLHHLFARALR